MSRDLILKDDDGNRYSYDNIRAQSFEAGKVPGLQQAAALLENRAVEMFRQRKDEWAKVLRDLSLELVQLAEKARIASQKHEKEYPEVIA